LGFGTYHGLLGLGEVVQRVAVELHLSELGDGHELLGHNLGGIEKIESKSELVLFFHDLDTELTDN
jgi:hypothetical protein